METAEPEAPEPEAALPEPVVDDDAGPGSTTAYEHGAVVHDDDGDARDLDEEEDTGVSQGTCTGHIADVCSLGSTLLGWLSWLTGSRRTGLECAQKIKETAASWI